jgi:hypothetical protein
MSRGSSGHEFHATGPSRAGAFDDDNGLLPSEDGLCRKDACATLRAMKFSVSIAMAPPEHYIPVAQEAEKLG